MMHALDRRPFKDMRRQLIDEFERRYLYQLLQQHRFDLTEVVRSARLSPKLPHCTGLQAECSLLWSAP